MRKSFILTIVIALFAALLAACGSGGNQENAASPSASNAASESAQPAKSGGEVNVYSARHYDVDNDLYQQFTEKTGIKVNVVDGSAAELIERLKREGASSPADLFITVDGGILDTAKKAGILQPMESAVLDQQVPQEYRDPENYWIGLSTRARVIVYAKDRVDPSELSTYEDLATEKWKGKLLVRSSTNMYNQSLLASLIELNGEEAAEKWAAGIVANMARDPEGGDRDQAKAVVAGVGDVAIMNTYYVGQLSASKDPEEVKVAESIGVFFPNQETTGTHLNISGAGLTKHSKNKENAMKLVEFLTSKEAQEYVSSVNFEYPVNPEAEWPELLKSWGPFKHQDIEFAAYGENNPKAVEIANKVGWK
jgi:iron(III) transport system substrate-binding protein